MAQSSNAAFLRIGTRGSPLALWQAREVRARLAGAHGV
jgi:hydroxymethylbilane synthase